MYLCLCVQSWRKCGSIVGSIKEHLNLVFLYANLSSYIYAKIKCLLLLLINTQDGWKRCVEYVVEMKVYAWVRNTYESVDKHATFFAKEHQAKEPLEYKNYT